jgi:hypothetical protein
MVKCVQCGLLAVRHTETEQLREVTLEYREYWENLLAKPANPPGQLEQRYNPVPACIVMAANLSKVVGDVPPFPAKVSKVITMERECDKFVAWMQGHTPREHQDRILAERMLEKQQERENNRLKEDREYRDEQRRQDLDREEKRAREDRETAKREGRRFWIMFVVGMTLVPLFAAVLQVYGPAWLQNQKDKQPTEPTGKTPARTNFNEP